jgi:tight adherence protein C
MEYLLYLFTTLANDPVQGRWLFAAAIGAACALFTLGILLVGAGLSDPLRRRLSAVTGAGANSKPSARKSPRVISQLAPYALPRKQQEVSKTKAALIAAGYRTENAVSTFYAIKMLLGIGVLAVVVLGASFVPGLTTMQVVTGALMGSLLATMLPNLMLRRRLAKRKRQLMNGFPDALDLLVTCTEAGLGLTAALQRVANEFNVSHPLLAEELTLVNAEIRAGIDRIEALKHLAERTDLEDIRGLVSLIGQSVRFGTSIANTLRVYSEELRDKRMQRAEEQAAKIGTKMIFPLVLCMFPAFFLVAIGPAILGVLRALNAS